MAWRCGTSARTVMSSARSYLPRIRPSPPPVHANRLRSRLSLPTTTRSIGCAQSLMPLHGVVAATHLTSHISVHARAFCDLSQEDAQVYVHALATYGQRAPKFVIVFNCKTI
ncbi:hypothetical protein CUMW_125110 [Citrus unshiu]|nr:hypothetical protein CUMW_125110 [Citrus unshiu]